MNMMAFRPNTMTEKNIKRIINLMNEYENLTGCGSLIKGKSHIIRTAINKECQYWEKLVNDLKSK